MTIGDRRKNSKEKANGHSPGRVKVPPRIRPAPTTPSQPPSLILIITLISGLCGGAATIVYVLWKIGVLK